MSTLIEDVLAAWRDAERVLDELPAVHADHETVARAVAELRALYGELTGAGMQSRSRIRASAAAVERTRALLERARRAIERAEPAPDGSSEPPGRASDAPSELSVEPG